MPQNTQPGHFGADSPAYVFGRKNLDYQGPQSNLSATDKKNLSQAHNDFSDESEKVSISDLDYDDNSMNTPIKNIDFPDVFSHPEQLEDGDGDVLIVSSDSETGEIYAEKNFYYGNTEDTFNDLVDVSGIKKKYPDVFDGGDNESQLKATFEYKMAGEIIPNELKKSAEKYNSDNVNTNTGIESDLTESYFEDGFGYGLPAQEFEEPTGELRYNISTTFSPGKNGDYGGSTFSDILGAGENISDCTGSIVDEGTKMLNKEAQRIRDENKN